MLPDAPGFDAYELVVLDVEGAVLDKAGRQVPTAHLPTHLRERLAVPSLVTDIFVFVHGWMNTRQSMEASARRLFNGIVERYKTDPRRYPGLFPFRPYFVAVRWPSVGDYWSIRDLAHAMSRQGHAAHLLAEILGYLDAGRTPPEPAPPELKTRDGQYLHCVGHSFGGRFLAEAIRWAAEPPTPLVLGTRIRNEYPFGVDTFLAFQMAARPDIFDRRLPTLVHNAPIHGPIVLTMSDSDWANTFWHRLGEFGRAGIGAVGARSASGTHVVPLKGVDENYTDADFGHRITNIDAGWLFTKKKAVVGAHSDYWHEESVHLLLSLADLVRLP
jgi:hypothetical protein